MAAQYILEDQYKFDLNYERDQVIELATTPAQPTNVSFYNRWLAEMNYGYTQEEFDHLIKLADHLNPLIVDAAIDRMYYAVYLGYPGANLDSLIEVVDTVLLDTDPLKQQIAARAVKMYEDYLGELSPIVQDLGIKLDILPQYRDQNFQKENSAEIAIPSTGKFKTIRKFAEIER